MGLIGSSGTFQLGGGFVSQLGGPDGSFTPVSECHVHSLITCAGYGTIFLFFFQNTTNAIIYNIQRVRDVTILHTRHDLIHYIKLHYPPNSLEVSSDFTSSPGRVSSR